jgi:hypothetical protein
MLAGDDGRAILVVVPVPDVADVGVLDAQGSSRVGA